MSVFKIISSIAFLIICVFINAQDVFDNPNLEKANKLIAEKEYAEALAIINGELEKDNKNIQTLELKLNVSVKTENEKDVLKDIEKVLEQEPDNPEFIYLRAVVYFHMRKYTKAIEDFDKSIVLDIMEEYKPKVFLNKAMCHFYLHEYDLAEENVNFVLDLDNKNANAYHSLGMIRYETQVYDEAVDNFLKALKFENNNPITFYNLGMTYLKLKDGENACRYFNKSCDLSYKNACKMLYLECTNDNR